MPMYRNFCTRVGCCLNTIADAVALVQAEQHSFAFGLRLSTVSAPVARANVSVGVQQGRAAGAAEIGTDFSCAADLLGVKCLRRDPKRWSTQYRVHDFRVVCTTADARKQTVECGNSGAAARLCAAVEIV